MGHKCDRLEICASFRTEMKRLPAMMHVIQDKYCAGDSQLCARKLIAVSMGAQGVPDDLYPNDMGRAARLLNDRTPARC